MNSLAHCTRCIAFYMLLLLAGSSVMHAQPASILFATLNTNNGLSHNDIKTIYKDRTGFVWIGTQDGLNRYDGKTCKIFRHNAHDSQSVSNNVISKITEDEQGNYWVATHRGLNQYDPATEKFTCIPFYDQEKRSDGDREIADIAENPFDHSLWAATAHGLCRVNKAQKKQEPAPDNDSSKLLSTVFVTRILFEKPDRYWLGTYQGLLLYNPQTGHYRHFFTDLNNKNAMYDNLVKSLYFDSFGHLWVGTWGAGLRLFDTAAKVFTADYLPDALNGKQGASNIIIDIAQTNIATEKNILWIASVTTPLLAFNTDTKTFTAVPGSQSAYPFEIQCLYFTATEGLWIGTQKAGIYRYDPQLQLFTEHNFQYLIKKSGLGMPFSIYADPLDSSGRSLWVGTWNCGLFQYQLGTEQANPAPGWIMKSFLPAPSIYQVYRDRRQALWMATGSFGLIAADEKNKQAVSMLPVDAAAHKHANSVYSLLEDAQHQLWMGTDSGVFVLDSTRKKFTYIGWKNVPPGQPIATTVFGITSDLQGNIWFSTGFDVQPPAIIGKISKGTYKATAYYYNAREKNSFPEPYLVRNIVCDNKNHLWCGTHNGLITWNAADEEPAFTYLTEEDGLCNNFVHRISRDKNGNLWIGTIRGLSFLNTATRSFVNFYSSGGLEADDISRLPVNNITGEIMPAFQGKFYTVHPDHIHGNTVPPPVIITGFMVGNQPYRINEKLVSNNSVVKLGPDRQFITIDFAALAFTNSGQIKYAYKMDGVNTNWVFTAGNSISYNLADGDYTFTVKACNADGVWNNTGASLHIYIRPPFYKTIWFIALCVLLAALLMYVVFRIRINRMKAIEVVRNNIAKDLHDEIGSTLTSINILSRVSSSNLEKDRGKASGLLQKITEQSQNMQQSMSDIVWAIRPENDKIENMIVRMREYLSQTLEAKDISIELNASDEVLQRSLPMRLRRDFLLIFKEAVNNAAKYAQCKKLVVELNRQGHELHLLIVDDGQGFDVDRVTSSSGIKNMKERAQALGGRLVIHSQPGKGTSVQLICPAT